jgi:hypothetical protein
MAAAMGYALRRTSARAVLLIGVGGLLWMVWVAEPYRAPGLVAEVAPIPFLWWIDPYRVVGSGFPPWDVAAAAVVAVVAVVAAAVLWRERPVRR